MLTHATITRGLTRLGATGWTLSGDTLDGLEWPDDNGPVPTEAELLAALAPSAADVKAEAAARIRASGHDDYAIRKIATGEPIPQPLLDYAAAVRAASDALEALEPIPADYAADHHWPERPA